MAPYQRTVLLRKGPTRSRRFPPSGARTHPPHTPSSSSDLRPDQPPLQRPLHPEGAALRAHRQRGKACRLRSWPTSTASSTVSAARPAPPRLPPRHPPTPTPRDGWPEGDRRHCPFLISALSDLQWVRLCRDDVFSSPRITPPEQEPMKPRVQPREPEQSLALRPPQRGSPGPAPAVRPAARSRLAAAAHAQRGLPLIYLPVARGSPAGGSVFTGGPFLSQRRTARSARCQHFTRRRGNTEIGSPGLAWHGPGRSRPPARLQDGGGLGRRQTCGVAGAGAPQGTVPQVFHQPEWPLLHLGRKHEARTPA